MLGATTDTLLCRSICAAALEGAEISTVNRSYVLGLAASLTCTVAVPPLLELKMSEATPLATGTVQRGFPQLPNVPSEVAKITLDWLGALTVMVFVAPIARLAGLLGLEMKNADAVDAIVKSCVAE